MTGEGDQSPLENTNSAVKNNNVVNKTNIFEEDYSTHYKEFPGLDKITSQEFSKNGLH